MPKYIKKRKRGERKKHEFFNGIEHKYCGTCSPPQWKPLDQFGKRGNGKQSYCKACKKKKCKQRKKAMKEKRKKEREAARGTGFLVCLNTWCTVKGMQPLDQFIDAHVHIEETTDTCQTCRDKVREAQKRREAPCQKVWDDWRKTHPCVKCMNDPNYVHNPLLIEADHLPEYKKVKACSQVGYWCHSKRGPRKLELELMKCQALCGFHHALITQQRDHDKGRILKRKFRLRRRAIMNKEKHKRGCCLRCERVLKKGEERAFHFDHRDDSTKFMYKGEAVSPSAFIRLPDALFDKQWPLEKELVDLLCANCHTLKTKVNKDGYK